MLSLRGDLRLEQAQMELAETDYREAISLSRKIGARALEFTPQRRPSMRTPPSILWPN